jgi:hypothetical protein
VKGFVLASRGGFGVRRSAPLWDPIGQQLGQRQSPASASVLLEVAR